MAGTPASGYAALLSAATKLMPDLKTAIVCALIAGAAATGAYYKGYDKAKATFAQQALQSQIETLQRDNEIERLARADAEKRADDNKELAGALREKVRTYEKSLEANPACGLSPTDVERLRAL